MAELGGATLALAEGVDSLAERGHSVDVVLPIEGRLRDRLAKARSVIVQGSNRWMAREGLSLLGRSRQFAFDLLRAAPALVRIAAASSIDVVVTNTLTSPLGALVARRARRPHVWFIHEFGDLDHGYRFVWGKGFSLALMRRLSALFVVNSEALERHFAKWFGNDRLRVARYSVDVDLQRPCEVTSSGHRELRLIQIGTRSEAKGQIDAVRAAALLRARDVPVELELVGGYDPCYDQFLNTEIKRLELRGSVHLREFDPCRFQRIAAANVAVVCSPCEAFGRFTVEAMKLGKPVVGAAGGATPELIRNGENGFLYTPGHPEELADRVEMFARTPSLISELGHRGSIWAHAHFNRERYGADLEQALQAAIDDR